MKDTPLPAQPVPVHDYKVIKCSKRVLSPVERATEVLFELIMVLMILNSLDVAETVREGVRTMLLGALGCNLAWGIIDAVLYLMGRLADRGGDSAPCASCAKPPVTKIPTPHRLPR